MNDTYAAVWRALNDDLIAALDASGALTDPRWREAFRATPRHVFVPRLFADDGSIMSGVDPATRDAWLQQVYSDTSLVVQRAPVPGYDREIATSSSTMPSLMARMLELLAVEDGNHVLEIGTATGYNAAVLSRRLGDNNVTSIELHPDLVATARNHLAALDFYPAVFSGDGAAGQAVRAPYDRIIATCAADAIPTAWIGQLAHGGRIVADFRSEMASSLCVLVKTAPDRVEGSLLGHAGHFMWLRPDPASPLLHPNGGPLVVERDGHATVRGSATDIDLSLLESPSVRTLVGFLEPDMHAPFTFPEGEAAFFHADDGSWCEATTTTTAMVTHVVQGGPRRLWDSIEHATRVWENADRPQRGRYGLTVTTDGVHTCWIDTPDQPILTVKR